MYFCSCIYAIHYKLSRGGGEAKLWLEQANATPCPKWHPDMRGKKMEREWGTYMYIYREVVEGREGEREEETGGEGGERKEGKGRERKGREGKGREGKGRGINFFSASLIFCVVPGLTSSETGLCVLGIQHVSHHLS